MRHRSSGSNGRAVTETVQLSVVHTTSHFVPRSCIRCITIPGAPPRPTTALFQSPLQRAEAFLRDRNTFPQHAKLSPRHSPRLRTPYPPSCSVAASPSPKATSAPPAPCSTKAASLAPDKHAPQFLLGFFYYVDNDFLRARPVLERARHLAPRDPQTALFLAMTYDGLALPDLSRPAFEQTLTLKDSAEARIAFARTLTSRASIRMPKFATSLASPPTSADSRDAHYEQARLHFIENRFAESITEAERALQLKGDGTSERSIHFLLSLAYDRSGDKSRAAEHRRAFEAIPPRLIR